MHYMPWFQAKPVSPNWGSHWKMANKNPDIIVDEATGKRQIASHYYPLIGPYDSKDPDVIEYHLLLMKYCGVDAVLIDWYGSHNINDYRVNLNATNATIDKLDDVGLKFAAVYEEYTAGVVQDQTAKPAMEAAKADMSYLQTNYFSNKQYLRISDTPVLLAFGPRFFKQPAQWTEIFASMETKPKFLPLWNHGSYVGDNDRSCSRPARPRRRRCSATPGTRAASRSRPSPTSWRRSRKTRCATPCAACSRRTASAGPSSRS